MVLEGARDWVLSARFASGTLLGGLLVHLATRRLPHGSSVVFNLPFNLGSATISASHADRVAAWKLYVQLKTRKAAIPFDDANDVVVEVYDSLLTLFEATRALLLELPPAEFAKDDRLASLMLRVLNDGVRPHLTRWQADFRRWWDAASRAPENADCSPQEIQRGYPRYAELLVDLQRTNTELSRFADELLNVARGVHPQKDAGRRFLSHLWPHRQRPIPPTQNDAPCASEEAEAGEALLPAAAKRRAPMVTEPGSRSL